jgi:hypothetical protein
MTYKDKLKSISTIEELYDFREELLKDVETNETKAGDPFDDNKLKRCIEANFFLVRVNNRIKNLESKDIFLDNIKSTTPEEK